MRLKLTEWRQGGGGKGLLVAVCGSSYGTWASIVTTILVLNLSFTDKMIKNKISLGDKGFVLVQGFLVFFVFFYQLDTSQECHLGREGLN